MISFSLGLMSKKATLHVYHAFLNTFLLSLHNYDVKLNDQILSLLENGNGKAMNSTISVWTRARSLLFSSNQNSPLLSNRANWYNREKGCEVYFSAMFSWTSRLSDRKAPIEWPRGEGWKPLRRDWRVIKRSEDWNLVYQALSANSAIKSVQQQQGGSADGGEIFDKKVRTLTFREPFALQKVCTTSFI